MKLIRCVKCDKLNIICKHQVGINTRANFINLNMHEFILQQLFSNSIPQNKMQTQKWYERVPCGIILDMIQYDSPDKFVF